MFNARLGSQTKLKIYGIFAQITYKPGDYHAWRTGKTFANVMLF